MELWPLKDFKFSMMVCASGRELKRKPRPRQRKETNSTPPPIHPDCEEAFVALCQRGVDLSFNVDDDKELDADESDESEQSSTTSCSSMSESEDEDLQFLGAVLFVFKLKLLL